jgi:NADH-quinone oxidoreductase subunit A
MTKDSTQMPIDYLPILIMVVLAGLFSLVALILPTLLGPRIPNATKLEAYESGKLPYGDARRKMPISYYRVAMLFLIFDVEVVFFYPWAVVLRQLKLFGLIEMGIFALFLGIGYIYEWKKGGLELD